MNTILKRTISGAVYLGILLSCILCGTYSFLVLSVIMVGIMMGEFMHMTMGNEYRFPRAVAILAGVMLFTMTWGIRTFANIGAENVLLTIIPIGVLMVMSLYVKDKSDFGKFANVYTAILYIAVSFSSVNFLVIDEYGVYNGFLLICFFVIIWLSDIGAYIFGITLGQKYGKKLFESISPKKSWIGFWGGMLLAVAGGLVMYFTGIWQYAGLKSMTWYHALLLSVVMNIAGVYGDLFESQWKRHYAVKDSGKIIPGHGGLLDRLDSTLFAVPAGILYLFLFDLFTVVI